MDGGGGTPVFLLAAHILRRRYGASQLSLGVGMDNKNQMGVTATMFATAAAFVLALLAFYGLDHFIMAIQGLPLNLDLSPAG